MIPPSCAEFCLEFLDERAPIVILRVDAAGAVKWANPYTLQLLGRDPAGTSLAGVFFDPHQLISMPALAQDPREKHLLHLNVSSHPPQTLYFNVRAFDGEFLMLGCHDPQEQIRLERNVLLLNRELSNMSRELQKSGAELGRLLEVKNQFLGMAAHDLRNPAGAICNFSEFLLKETGDELSPTHREFLEFIQDASRRIVRLIEDFLDVSVINAGRLQLRCTPASLADVIKDALPYVHFRATSKGVDIITEAAPDLPVLNLDAPKMVQVVGNLLNNAVEHSPKGTTVRVRCLATPEGVQVSVQDSGPGVPADKLANLFTPFSGTGETKSSGERSIGLGLSIARKIVEAHNGRIWADSTPGQGSTFTFRLPLNVTE